MSLNDEPSFDFSPPHLDHVIEFNLTSQTFSGDQYFYDIDSGSSRQINFCCGFRDGDTDLLTDHSDITLYVQESKLNERGRVRKREKE